MQTRPSRLLLRGPAWVLRLDMAAGIAIAAALFLWLTWR
jgi:hypothetical protein